MTAHLDDEQLSAALDGDEPTGAHRAHLDECPACAGRQRGLAAAAQAVAAPVEPIDPVVLEALISRAVAEAAVAAGTVVSIVGGSRRRRPLPPPAWLVGAAAALLALVGLAGLLRETGTTTAQDSASRALLDEDRLPRRPPGQPETAAGPPAAAADPEVVSWDLGDQDDPSTLTGALATSVTSGAVTAHARASDNQEGFAQQAPAKVSPARAAGSGGAVADRAQCTGEARALGGPMLGAQLSTATLRWKGEPAEVLVFALAEPTAGVSRQALVFRRPGCDLLADPRF